MQGLPLRPFGPAPLTRGAKRNGRYFVAPLAPLCNCGCASAKAGRSYAPRLQVNLSALVGLRPPLGAGTAQVENQRFSSPKDCFIKIVF